MECPHNWDIRPAIASKLLRTFYASPTHEKATPVEYIQPVMDRLSDLHNFTVESQVQYFAPLAFEPVPLGNDEYGLTQEQLSVFVNSAEWTLCKHVVLSQAS